MNTFNSMPLRTAILSLFILAVTGLSASQTSTIDSLMNVLDDVIAHRADYQQQKERRLDEIRLEVSEARNDTARFEALVRLYDQFNSFNTDSAYNLSLQQEAVALRAKDAVMLTHARMNIANIFNATGMYYETLKLTDTINPAFLPDYLRSYYYHIMRTVYGRLEDYAAFQDEKERYRRLTNIYRDSIMYANSPSSLAYVITKADRHNIDKRPDLAIDIMMRYIREHDLGEHDRAICAWTLSESYGCLGDKQKQKELLLISSISDLRSAVREYISLRQLALLLYDEGDLERAHKFMTVALDDAAKCNARQRIIELNKSFPKLNNIYLSTIESHRKSLERTIFIITFLGLVLLASLFFMRKQMHRIARARKEIEDAYDKLNTATEQLIASNEKLSNANNAIAENSELKEVYIGRYMDQCLVYIEKLDTYRKTLGKLVNAGKIDELKKLVKSSAMTDDELKLFYDQFDKTFLSLFPTFVSDLNNLLLPEEAIIPKKEGSLSPELRIYALIRLGITDSNKIAKFLRYSLTTIYNYRTKVRNKAKGDRNKLELEIQSIGRAAGRG